MAKHLQRDIDYLRHEILAVGTLVEEAIDKALRVLAERDAALIDEIVAGRARQGSRSWNCWWSSRSSESSRGGG